MFILLRILLTHQGMRKTHAEGAVVFTLKLIVISGLDVIDVSPIGGTFSVLVLSVGPQRKHDSSAYCAVSIHVAMIFALLSLCLTAILLFQKEALRPELEKSLNCDPQQ